MSVQHISEAEFDKAVEAAQDKCRLARLRNYLRPILIQEALNIAAAAAQSISDFEAMKRASEMLRRIEDEEA